MKKWIGVFAGVILLMYHVDRDLQLAKSIIRKVRA